MVEQLPDAPDHVYTDYEIMLVRCGLGLAGEAGEVADTILRGYIVIINADVLEWAKTYTGPKFHALLCDPPYHLVSITERFGKAGSAAAQFGSDGAFQRASKGFMGRDWDGVGPDGIGIAFRPSTWAAIAQHLYPGAWGMVFASSRGWHRLAVAIEDAGLIIQPTIFGWSYGSGFPKATNISAQIDDRAFRAWLDDHPVERDQLETLRQAARLAPKVERVAALRAYQQARKQIKQAAGFAPVSGTKKHQPKFAAAELGYREKDNGFNSKERESFDVHGPATASAADWAGHRYGGQCLKPAIEPVIVFQKPYEGSPVDNITSTGAGALWIDGGRIGTDDTVGASGRWGFTPDAGWNANSVPNKTSDQYQHTAGRWPANLVLVHSPLCNGVCVPSCPVARLGAQSGDAQSSGMRPTPYSGTPGLYGGHIGTEQGKLYDDSGTASRYFYAADWMLDRLEAADPVAYIAKASTAEREAGLDPRQTALMRLLDEDAEDFEGSNNNRYHHRTRQCTVCGTRANNGHGGTACEHDSWEWVKQHVHEKSTINDGRDIAIDNPYQRGETTRRNIHPTIKPISLSRYLATLLLPPAAYGPRRLLIPFSGAGSECIGAMLAGWEEITGVELEAEHVAIANARLAYWKQRAWELSDPDRKPTVVSASQVPAGQLDMFMEDT
jgi:site-specific DNA-methyltransferase (adenine-specific)